MKKMKRASVILCLAAAGMSALVGCSSKNESAAVTTMADKGRPEPVEIKIFNRLNPEVNVEQNDILDELEKKLNIKIDYEAPPISNYNEKLQIAMASGELPDIIYNWTGADMNYEKWAKDGLLAKLDNKLEHYPNIMANVPKEYWEVIRSTQTGKIHAIPRPNVDNYWGFLINQNWLDNLGLKAPETLEEFKDVMHKFTYDDPNDNGMQDTYGLTFEVQKGETVKVLPLNFTFGLEATKDFDGQYKIRERKSGYIPYLTFLRELYLDGSLDPEFATNTKEAVKEKFLSERVGTMQDHQVGIMTLLPNRPDADKVFRYIGSMEQENGSKVEYVTPSIWGAWIISADGNVDNALELIDYGMSKEGFILMSLGIQGEHYNSYDFENRMVDRTEEQNQKLMNTASSYFTFAYAKDGAAAIVENVTTSELIDKYFKELSAVKDHYTIERVPNVRAPLFATFNSDNPDVVTKLAEMEIQYIVGEVEQAEFERFLDETYFPAAAEMEKEYVEWLNDYENSMK